MMLSSVGSNCMPSELSTDGIRTRVIGRSAIGDKVSGSHLRDDALGISLHDSADPVRNRGKDQVIVTDIAGPRGDKLISCYDHGAVSPPNL
jgi:hypothetical protein